MTSRRLLKAAEAIREVVASSILTELRDPRVRDVTVIGVEVTPDMREAKVAVSVMGDDTQQRLSLRGLQNAAGFLQSKIADRIETRYTPKLQFVLDKGIQHSLLVNEILQKIKDEKDGIQSTSETGAELADVDDFDANDFDSEEVDTEEVDDFDAEDFDADADADDDDDDDDADDEKLAN